MATLTAYPTSGDGLVRNNGSSAWATLRNAASGTVASQYNPTQVYNDGTSADKYIDRSILCFDLTSLPPNAVISAAVLSVYGTTVASGAGGAVCLVSANPASTTTLAVSDFDDVGSTEYATRVNFAALSTGAYTDFALNAAGLTYLTGKLGTTAGFALRGSFDLDNSAPGTSVYSQFSFNTTDASGTSQDPKLVVTYTLVERAGADALAWSDSTDVAAGGGATLTATRAGTDTLALSDAAAIYRRSRTDVLVRDVGPQTQVHTSTYTGGATLTVASTTGFASAGTVYVQTSDFLSQGRVVYTGKTSTTFTGCTFTLLRGSASFPTGSSGMVMAPDTTNHFPRVTKLDTTDHPPLLVSWTQHGSHGMLDGALKCKITYDGGVTFGSEQTIIDSPANGDGWGVYGHTLTRCKNGRLFCMWYEHKYDYMTADSIANFWTMASYSDDNGTSWSTPVEYDTPYTYGPRAGSCGFASEVYTGAGSDSTYGDIYIPVVGNDDGIQVHGSGEPYRWYGKLMKITDGGASGTWTEVGDMATTTDVGGRAVGEQGIAFLDDGTWMTHLRVENLSSGEDSPYYPYYQRWQATSTDQGATWTGHTRIAPLGNGGVVFEIPGGTLISSGQDIDRASGCTDYISYDQGTTWTFNRVETTDATYAYYAGSDAELIIDDPYVSRNTAFTWGDEKSTQTGARVQFRWFFDPSRSFDTLDLSDTAIRTTTTAKAGADTLALSDAASNTQTRAATDTVSFVDTAASALTIPATGADALSLTDTATSQRVNLRDAADTLAWTDTGTRTTTAGRAPADSLAFTDTSPRTVLRLTSVTDTLTLSDSASGTVSTLPTAPYTLTGSSRARYTAAGTSRRKHTLQGGPTP